MTLPGKGSVEVEIRDCHDAVEIRDCEVEIRDCHDASQFTVCAEVQCELNQCKLS